MSATQTWVRSLLICNMISWMIGVCVFGLALGTVKDNVFQIRVWSYLAPLFGMACADIAAGVFIWIVTAWGFFTLSYRTSWFHVPYITALVINFMFQMCTGIATLVICAEKVDAWHALTKALCVRNVTPKLLAYQALSNLQPLSSADHSAVVNASPTVDFKDPLTNILTANGSPFNDCSNFNDLMTPAGALLIVGSLLYMYMLVCAIALYKDDSERKPSQNGRPKSVRPETAQMEL